MKHKLLTLIAVAMAGAAGCGIAFSHDGEPPNHGHFVNAKGKEIGWVTATQTAQGVLLHLEVKGVSKGWHGIHLHAAGKCEGPDFKSAGGHFNPMGTQHGYEQAQGPHIGDLPNFYVGSNKQAKVEIFAAHTSLTAGAHNSLIDADGTALVIHAKADDYKSQPSGDSGDREACAVLPKN